MLRTLRIPLIALALSILLLGGALYLRFANDDNAPDSATPAVTTENNAVGENESGVTDQATPATPVPIATPVPTLAPVREIQPPTPGQLVEGLVGNVSKLNPLFASLNPVDRDITTLIFEGLTTTNEFGETIPLLAERWEVSRDGLEYVFLLRRDIMWHDGTPFTSRDVEYTINTIRHADFPGEQSLRNFWQTVEMTVIDDFTLRFRLVQPLAAFPEQLKIGLLPAHVLAGYPVAELYRHPFNLSPIGTGPYQLENLYIENEQWAISLRVAPVYRQRPEGQGGYALDRILFRTFASVEEALSAFARGEVNSVANVPTAQMEGLASLRNAAVYSRVEPTVGVLLYNWDREGVEYLANPRTHQAFALALDRQTAVAGSLGGTVILAESPLIPGVWGYAGEVQFPTPNLEQAQALLNSISFEREVVPTESAENGEDAETNDDSAPTEGAVTTTPADPAEGPTPTPTVETETVSMRRSLSILVVNRPQQVTLAENIAAQLSALGLTVTVDANSAPTYRSRLVSGDFDLAIVEYTFAPYADPDPYVFWHVSQSNGGANYASVNDLRLNNLIERARREQQGSLRVELYRQLQQRFVERAPALPLYHPLYIYMVDQRLQGVQLGYLATPADRFRTIADWQWATEVLAQPNAGS